MVGVGKCHHLLFGRSMTPSNVTEHEALELRSKELESSMQEHLLLFFIYKSICTKSHDNFNLLQNQSPLYQQSQWPPATLKLLPTPTLMASTPQLPEMSL